MPQSQPLNVRTMTAICQQHAIPPPRPPTTPHPLQNTGTQNPNTWNSLSYPPTIPTRPLDSREDAPSTPTRCQFISHKTHRRTNRTRHPAYIRPAISFSINLPRIYPLSVSSLHHPPLRSAPRPSPPSPRSSLARHHRAQMDHRFRTNIRGENSPCVFRTVLYSLQRRETMFFARKTKKPFAHVGWVSIDSFAIAMLEPGKI